MLKDQIGNQISEGLVPGLAEFKKLYSIRADEEMTHECKDNRIYEFPKSIETIIERYGREYRVAFIYDKTERSVELQSIDNNNDLEDTFNESFLSAMECACIESILKRYDNDEAYDNQFQGPP